MTNALLATFNTSMWSITRQDKRLTADACKDLDLDRKAGAFKKNRLDPANALWRNICRARDAGRAVHYAYTLPWQEGLRLVNPLAIDEYSEAMKAAENTFYAAVDAFLGDVNAQKLEAAQLLGNYYRDSDYADLNRDAFAFGCSLSPMPHDAQFDALIDIIGEERANALADELKDKQTQQWAEATRSVWERVYKALRHASDKLHNGQRLHASVMDNLQELTDLLPVLNVTDDKDLEKARKKLRALFKQYSAETVKDDGNRKSCAAQVDAILQKLPAI